MAEIHTWHIRESMRRSMHSNIYVFIVILALINGLILVWVTNLQIYAVSITIRIVVSWEYPIYPNFVSIYKAKFFYCALNITQFINFNPHAA